MDSRSRSRRSKPRINYCEDGNDERDPPESVANLKDAKPKMDDNALNTKIDHLMEQRNVSLFQDHVVGALDDIDFDRQFLKLSCWSFFRGDIEYEVPIVVNCPEIIIKWSDLQKSGGFKSHADFLNHLLKEEGRRQDIGSLSIFPLPPLAVKWEDRQLHHSDGNASQGYVKCSKCQLVFADTESLSYHNWVHEAEENHEGDEIDSEWTNDTLLQPECLIGPGSPADDVKVGGDAFSLDNLEIIELGTPMELEVACNAVVESSAVQPYIRKSSSLSSQHSAVEDDAFSVGALEVIEIGTPLELEVACNAIVESTPAQPRTRKSGRLQPKKKPVIKFFCGTCKKRFKSEDLLNQHYKTVHKRRAKWPCIVCSAVYADKRAHQRHYYMHTGVKQFECKKCQKQFTTRIAHANHVKSLSCRHIKPRQSPGTSTNDPNGSTGGNTAVVVKEEVADDPVWKKTSNKAKNRRRWPCVKCGIVYKDRRSFLSHNYIHTGIKAFKCQKCEKPFGNVTAYRNHTEGRKGRCMKSNQSPETCTNDQNSTDGDIKVKLEGKREVEDPDVGLEASNLSNKAKGRRSWPCVICGIMYKDRRSFLSHNYIHTGVKGFKCQVCHQQFSNRGHYRNHTESRKCWYKKPGQPPEASTNDQNRTGGDLQVAVKKEVEDEAFGVELPKCDICLKVFTRSDSLRKHMRMVHRNGQLKCGACEGAFRTDKQRREHNCQHKGVGLFTCEFCEQEFAHKFFFYTHTCRTKSKLWVCKICSEQFLTLADLKVHLSKHGSEEFGDDPGITAYVATNADGEVKKKSKDMFGEFPCKVCKKVFCKERLLNRHQRAMHDEGNFPCTICDRKFRLSSTLKEHIARHTGLPAFKCRYCDLPFARHKPWWLHEREHTGVGQKVCEVCGLAFTDPYKLRMHVASHYKDMYKCSECRKVFLSAQRLQTHKKTHQAPEHFCKVCNRAFSRFDNMVKHERIHTGLRPYQCHCGKRFADKSNYNKHIAQKRSSCISAQPQVQPLLSGGPVQPSFSLGLAQEQPNGLM